MGKSSLQQGNFIYFIKRSILCIWTNRFYDEKIVKMSLIYWDQVDGISCMLKIMKEGPTSLKDILPKRLNSLPHKINKSKLIC